MKTHYAKKALFWAGVALSGVLTSSCDKPTAEVDPQSTASVEMEKIETAYYEGALKVETVGGSKKEATAANQSYIDAVLKEAKENYVSFNSRYRTARDISGGYDVGVIPTDKSCPLSSELIKIFVDNEDKNSKTAKNDRDGLRWNSSWSKDGGNSELYFCKIDGRLLNNSGGKFAVLKLGNTKPAGVKSVNFLFLDCEDSNGSTRFTDINSPVYISASTNAANASPNYVDSNHNLGLYWYVYNNAGNGAFPDVSFEYGVLGNPANPIDRSEFYTDDEDSGNGNTMSTIEGVQDVTARYQPEIHGQGTAFYTVVQREGYRDHEATGFRFIDSFSNPMTGPTSSQGTRFIMARVR